MRYQARVGGDVLAIDVDMTGRFAVDGEAIAAVIDESVRGRQWTIRIDGSSHEITLLTYDPMRLLVDGVELEASAIDERAAAADRGAGQRAAGRHELRAPMPGLLRAVHVKEGDIVERDAPLITLEAMKMENELRAPARGRVVSVRANAGDKVEGGATLVVLAASE
jgi:pyruvate carboxylase subunit B